MGLNGADVPAAAGGHPRPVPFPPRAATVAVPLSTPDAVGSHLRRNDAGNRAEATASAVAALAMPSTAPAATSPG